MNINNTVFVVSFSNESVIGIELLQLILVFESVLKFDIISFSIKIIFIDMATTNCPIQTLQSRGSRLIKIGSK